jgi:hypothetical protein
MDTFVPRPPHARQTCCCSRSADCAGSRVQTATPGLGVASVASAAQACSGIRPGTRRSASRPARSTRPRGFGSSGTGTHPRRPTTTTSRRRAAAPQTKRMTQRVAVDRVAVPPKRDSDPFGRAAKKGRQQSIAGSKYLPGFAPTSSRCSSGLRAPAGLRVEGADYVSTLRGDSVRGSIATLAGTTYSPRKNCFASFIT